MASISGLSGGTNLTSIYGNRNVISGLASGMDTEAMIKNAVSGYQMKITGLQQKQTKILWQQEAFRGIIDKMYSFTQKYTSFASSTNLMSASFFNSAVKAATNGKYADMVSSTGKTSSDVRLLGVQQLASAATYRAPGIGANGTIEGAEVNLAEEFKVSTVSGSITLQRGGNKNQTVTLDFKTDKIYKDNDELLNDIKDQLANSDMKDKIEAKLVDGKITFTDKLDPTQSVSVTGASGKIKDTLGLGSIDKNNPPKELDLEKLKDKGFSEVTGTMGEALSGKEFSVTVDGVTKKITLPTYNKEQKKFDEDVATSIEKQLKDAFGDKVTFRNKSGADGKLEMSFQVKDGSTMEISGGKALGLASDRETSYMNTSKTLGDILGKNLEDFDIAQPVGTDTSKYREVKDKDGNVTHYLDEKGNRLQKKDDGSFYRADDKGAQLYEFKVNGKSVGAFSENTAMESVLVAVNNNSDVNVSFSKLTNQFQFTSKETGAQSKIEFEGLSAQLFGASTFKDGATGASKVYATGQDAIFTMEVNGKQISTTRSGNTFDVDGLKVTLKGTFGYENGALSATAKEDAVSFTFSSDTEKIINAVKDMIKDYNEMAAEIKSAYTTVAPRKNGATYAPLTDEDRADMSESAIKAYEEQAKQGILFGNRDLSNLYDDMTSAISMSGLDNSVLRSIGITTKYSNGATTLELDEDKLKAALENNPDQVKDIFTKSKENGAESDGFMQALKTQLDRYGGTTGAVKGILVQHAGTPRAPTSLNQNSLQELVDSYNEQIERWTTKMSDKMDYYTSKFTQLEQLIAQMNSQSSTLAGLMGGMGGQ